MRAGAGMAILGQQKGSGAQAARYDPELQLVLASREGQRWAPRVEGAVHDWHRCVLLDYSIAMASPSPSLMDRPPSTVTLDQHPDKLQTDYRLLPTY